MAANSRGGRQIEMIEYPPGEEIIDHKGRSRPLYKPSTPRPSEWRPGRLSRVVLGWLPGLRLMATKSVPAGLPYALLGLVSGLGALLVLLNWTLAADTLRELRIHPRWILIRGTALLVLVCVYELLRLGATLEENRRPPLGARVLAALAAPALVVIVGAPMIMSASPRLLESAWFAALVVGFGAIPAAVACVFDKLNAASLSRFRIVAGLTLVFLIALAVFLPAFGLPLFSGLEGAARAAGFRVLPSLIP